MSEEIDLIQKLITNQQERLAELKQHQEVYSMRALPDDIKQEIIELEIEVEKLTAGLDQENVVPTVIVGVRNKLTPIGASNVRNMVAGDQISVGTISGANAAIGRSGGVSVSLAQLFTPLVRVVEANSGSLSQVESLRSEISRGENASDEKIASLIMDITDALPETANIITKIFANPMVARTLGGATRYVLRRIRE